MMAIKPLRIYSLIVCGFIRSQNKFCIQVNVFTTPPKIYFRRG